MILQMGESSSLGWRWLRPRPRLGSKGLSRSRSTRQRKETKGNTYAGCPRILVRSGVVTTCLWRLDSEYGTKIMGILVCFCNVFKTLFFDGILVCTLVKLLSLLELKGWWKYCINRWCLLMKYPSELCRKVTDLFQYWVCKVTGKSWLV